jgi:hypothetical protein
MRRISVSKRRNGVNSSPTFSQSRRDRRVFPTPGVGELGELVKGCLLGRRGVDGLEESGHLVPVLAGDVMQAVPQPNVLQSTSSAEGSNGSVARGCVQCAAGQAGPAAAIPWGW